jgi:D-glycero-D-manno-heptose 1,7-bisphosphate phosphatase
MGGLSGRRAVFLDRDGTLNASPPAGDYLRAAAAFRWMPGAPEALGVLAREGYALFVVSNQRGVALGVLDEAVLREIEAVIQRDLAREGCAIEAFRYCLHGLDAACACRKPSPGLIDALARERGIDVARSWMVGDMVTDHLAGRAAGCRTALVGAPPPDADPDVVAPDLGSAVRAILAGAPAAVAR